MADHGVPLAYVVPKEGAPAYLSVIGVVKGTKNKAIAEKYINMVLTPEAQTAWATIIGAGPAIKTVKLDPSSLVLDSRDCKPKSEGKLSAP